MTLQASRKHLGGMEMGSEFPFQSQKKKNKVNEMMMKKKKKMSDANREKLG